MTKAGSPIAPSVYLKHGSYYYVTQDDDKKQKWTNLGRDKKAAMKKYRSLVLTTKGDAYARRRIYQAADDESGPIPLAYLKEMLRNAKKNAKSRALEFTLTIDDIKELAERAGTKCQLTKIPFSYGVAEEAIGLSTRRKRLWAPSLDRLNPLQGYHLENVRIVCMAVNIARQEFSDDVLLKIARGLSNIRAPAL